MFTSPVVITWPGSMLVTRVIGRKTRRRPGTSTTRPDRAGCALRSDQHDDVADPAHLVADRVEDGRPGEARDEDLSPDAAHLARVVVGRPHAVDARLAGDWRRSPVQGPASRQTWARGVWRAVVRVRYHCEAARDACVRHVEGHAMNTVVQRDPKLNPTAGPVGLRATAVDISERRAWRINGFFAIVLALTLVGLGLWFFSKTGEVSSARGTADGLDLTTGDDVGAAAVLGVGCWLVAFFLLTSLGTVQPGETKVVQFLGSYVGTVRKDGLQSFLPMTTRRTVSVRVRNFETAHLKVNDATGNPVEIAAIVVWQVADTAKATFAVENYEAFIAVQSEAAVRHVAGAYPYDAADDAESLRGSTDQVSLELAHEVAARVVAAGLQILEVRISHLAYAPEIAQAMLQRQQASALVAARSRIVEGAVGMVEMALEALSRRQIVDLDPERKAAMVSNLLVVLCGESRATPVVNMGSLQG